MGHGSNNQNPRWAQLSVFLFYTGNSALSKALSEKPQSLVICPPEVETGTFYPNRKRFVTARGQRMLFSQALFINHLFCGAARGSKAKCPPLFFPGQMSQEILVGPPFLPPSSAGMSWGGGLKKLLCDCLAGHHLAFRKVFNNQLPEPTKISLKISFWIFVLTKFRRSSQRPTFGVFRHF